MISTETQIGFSSLTIDSCFRNHYIVPDYQREYVWEQTEVEQLLADLMEAFEASSAKDYFLGTIVTYKTGNCFELIDGQQRLTTFYLILCALRKHYMINNENSQVIDSLIFSPIMDSNGDTIPSYHLQLQYEEASNYLELIYNLSPAPSALSDSGKRLFDALNTIDLFFNNRLPDFTALKRFSYFLLNKSRFIQIETFDISDALKIFETINQRGVGLNPMDLLKNMIFRQVHRSRFKELNEKWQEIMSTLEKHKEKPLRFLRYFIMANYSVTNEKGGILREDQLYKWLTENNFQCRYVEDPFGFIRHMKSNVDVYISCLNPTNDNDGNIHLKNIPLLAGRSYRLHLLLLLSASNMEHAAFVKFKKTVESIVYYSVINKIPPNYTERIFTSWCAEVRSIKTSDDLENYINNAVMPIIDAWKKDNEQNFMRLGLNSMQKYRVKFIIAKIAAYVDALRIGKSEAGVLSDYMDSGIEIEHVMPVTCSDKQAYAVSEEDFEEYLNLFGNLTLLENSINKSIHNGSYAEKKLAYQQSKFYLTKSIPALVDQGSNTAITRTNQKLNSWDMWTKASIEARQKMLYSLSEEIWGIPSSTASQ